MIVKNKLTVSKSVFRNVLGVLFGFLKYYFLKFSEDTFSLKKKGMKIAQLELILTHFL